MHDDATPADSCKPDKPTVPFLSAPFYDDATVHALILPPFCYHFLTMHPSPQVPVLRQNYFRTTHRSAWPPAFTAVSTGIDGGEP